MDNNPGTPDSGARENEQQIKDPKHMPKNLKDWLTNGEYQKALKFTSAKLSKGSKTSMFFAIITAYCYYKTGKLQECLDILQEYKA